MNGSLGTLPPSSVPSSLSSAVTSPEDERRCALFSVGDEHAAVSRAASPAPIKVLLSTLVGSCPLPGLLWLVEAWSVIIERVSLSVLRDPMPGRWEGEPSSASQLRRGRLDGRGDEKLAVDHWSSSRGFANSRPLEKPKGRAAIAVSRPVSMSIDRKSTR